MEKMCTKCKIIKDYEEFHKSSKTKTGRKFECRKCVAVYKKSKKLDSNIWRKTKGKEWFRNWSRTKGKEYRNDRIKTNIQYRLYVNNTRRIGSLLKSKGLYKTKKSLKYLGCSSSQFKIHLESLFKNNMTWENYGSFWHIDHIKPASLFDLTKEEECNKAFHYTNLQPLEALKNMQKGNRWIG